jgi:radical SAM protein with 4Fe4S-binding SPASM domain
VKVRNDNKYPVEIGAQALLTPETLLSIRNTAFMAKNLGMDNFQVKPAHSHPKSSYHAGLYQFSHNEIEQQLMPLESDDFKVVVRTKSIERLLEPRKYKYCYGFNFYILIDANGNVTPCNVFYGNKEYTYGNINDESIVNIWESQRRLDIIEKIAQTCHSHCGDYRCRLDVINRYLDRVKNPEKNDDFI